MDSFWGALRFLQLGVQSNWFGLACPSHCGSPSVGALLASYFGGVLTVIVLGLAFGLRLVGFFWLPLAQSPEPQPAGLARLARYLHEPSNNTRQRRR